MNDLQVPFIINDILSANNLSDEDAYALSGVISDLGSDEALLAIAIAVRGVLAPYLQASPMMSVIKMQCDRIFDDYALAVHELPLSRINDKNTSYARISAVNEDLDYMNELLDYAVSYFEHKDTLAYDLCRLMQAQCQSHHLLTEMVCGQCEQNNIIGDCRAMERKSRVSDNVINVAF